jgi:SAM-dependent methyltransferase
MKAARSPVLPPPPDAVRADFDRLAAHAGEGWSHNTHYHAYLLRQFPNRCGAALDVGCGAGEFTRLLAERADHVVGVDLSPAMVAVARERAAGRANVELRVADVMEWDVPPASFDCIASIATLHHLALRPALRKLAMALRPGGTLAVLDLYRSETLGDVLASAAALPASAALRLIHHGLARPTRAAREAWSAHGRTDAYPTLAEVRRACEGVLPGARIRRHLLWRYSLVWTKPT